MHMNDEITHLRVVDGALGGALPGIVRLGVVGKDTDDVEIRQILELQPLERGQLAPEDEMQQLLGCRIFRCRGAHAGSP